MERDSQRTCCSSAGETGMEQDSHGSCCGSAGDTNIEQDSQDSCCGSASDCCSSNAKQTPLPEWNSGKVSTSIGEVLRVSTEWTQSDRLGQMKARVGSFRNHYMIEPGLYAFGEADEHSDVFVSANYKLSFDILRRALHGLNGWILVLDTKGINVWCAAGKGTFGTYELVNRVLDTQLEKIVSHRRLIVPQLGAPGVNSIEVQKRTGFKVMFGPVHAEDISAYIHDNYSALPAMRTIRFPLKDRLILTPIEIRAVLKYFPLYALIVLAIFGLQTNGILFAAAWNGGMPFLTQGLFSILAGALLTPVLLPFIPFRAFAIKGWLLGLLVVFASQVTEFCRIPAGLLQAAGFLFFPLLSSYIALQFTGATPVTSLSGVKKELRIGLPIYFVGGAISIFLLILYKVNEWGIY